MLVEVESSPDFEAMKLPQLKEELAARGSSRSGLKANLQRRLHGLLVESAIARRAEAAAEDDEPFAFVPSWLTWLTLMVDRCDASPSLSLLVCARGTQSEPRNPSSSLSR